MAGKKRKNSKDRGDRGERQVRDEFKEWWGGEFCRTPGSGAFATIHQRRDLNLSGDVSSDDDTFPWTVESKYVEDWDFIRTLKDQGDVWNWWEQTVRQIEEGTEPILVFRKNYQPWFYMMYPAEGQTLQRKMFACIDQYDKMVYIGLLDDLKKTDPDDWRKGNATQPT